MFTLNTYLAEGLAMQQIKKAIKAAVKEDPSRLGHGHTAKTSFWILTTGVTLPWSAWKKSWRRIVGDTGAMNVHSHSSASGKDDQGFDTFSGGDIASFRGGYHDQMGLISAKGQLHILQGGKYTKKDERFEDDMPGDADKTTYLKALAKARGGKLVTTTWK